MTPGAAVCSRSTAYDSLRAFDGGIDTRASEAAVNTGADTNYVDATFVQYTLDRT